MQAAGARDSPAVFLLLPLSGKSYTVPTFNKTMREEERPALLQALILLVPPIGFELMTYRLQGGCSTN